MRKNSKKSPSLKIVNPNAAGIDIGSRVHYVAVPDDRVGLTRFRGHLTKGGYDAKYGQANRCETDAPAVS